MVGGQACSKKFQPWTPPIHTVFVVSKINEMSKIFHALPIYITLYKETRGHRFDASCSFRPMRSVTSGTVLNGANQNLVMAYLKVHAYREPISHGNNGSMSMGDECGDPVFPISHELRGSLLPGSHLSLLGLSSLAI